MANKVKFISKKLAAKYVVINKKKFREKAEALALGLSAVALQHWVELAKSRFSKPTSAKYIDSIYWDSANLSNIKISVVKNTLADLLEGGQTGPSDLRKSFLKKSKTSKGGKRYRVIPIDENRQDNYVGKQYTTFGISTDAIMSSIDGIGGAGTAAMIKSKMGPFQKSNVPAKSFKDTASSRIVSMVGTSEVKFRTIFEGHSLKSPKDTWTHPGIQPALLANQVAEWMRTNRATFLEKLFE